METAIEWLIRILEGQKDEPFDYNEWEIAFKHALDMEKQQAERSYSEEEVRELLTQRSKHWGTSVKPFDKLLLRQDLEWFEQNKKK